MASDAMRLLCVVVCFLQTLQTSMSTLCDKLISSSSSSHSCVYVYTECARDMHMAACVHRHFAQYLQLLVIHRQFPG